MSGSISSLSGTSAVSSLFGTNSSSSASSASGSSSSSSNTTTETVNSDGTITITVTDSQGNVVSKTTEGTAKTSSASSSDTDGGIDTFA